ncbi:TPA: antirestriction protein, partial [Escherichia coli]
DDDDETWVLFNAMTVHYYRLRDYALQHPECSAIMRIID